ncbi:hypothetical protein Pflav_079740 [Phytohabitans flavus]|uniref:SGNH hydrolase-type esterase domain-containing protein n=1 Tax=Phytohabitans flavus TaxID=1076124 RepID=A0A6F8Y613_9ACTN|nr:hypothetical protein Pflav_079740 [Phytohabitans flavus]
MSPRRDDPWLRGARRAAKVTAVGAGMTGAAVAVGAGVLFGQAKAARRVIPQAEAPPPRGDGVYGPRLRGKPITMVVLGDSSAAGYGVHRPRETPGAMLAAGVSRRLRRPVRLHRFAVVGATSVGLGRQVEAALEVQPDLAIILVGGNDVTHRVPTSTSVRYLVNAVRDLRAAGAEVVVGTCPDLGTIRPIKPPLRWLTRHWSRQLATAQTMAVVEAGGWTVSLGDLLGPASRPTPPGSSRGTTSIRPPTGTRWRRPPCFPPCWRPWARPRSGARCSRPTRAYGRCHRPRRRLPASLAPRSVGHRWPAVTAVRRGGGRGFGGARRGSATRAREIPRPRSIPPYA